MILELRARECAPRDQRSFFQIELPLDAAARFVGDAAFAEHPVEVLPLGFDELQAEAVIERRSL